MEKETEIAAVGIGGGLLTWFTKKFTSRWRARFDLMQGMVDFWQANAEKLVEEIHTFQAKYDQLNKNYSMVIKQNQELIMQNNNLLMEVGQLRLEIKRLKGEII